MPRVARTVARGGEYVFRPCGRCMQSSRQWLPVLLGPLWDRQSIGIKNDDVDEDRRLAQRLVVLESPGR